LSYYFGEIFGGNCSCRKLQGCSILFLEIHLADFFTAVHLLFHCGGWQTDTRRISDTYWTGVGSTAVESGGKRGGEILK